MIELPNDKLLLAENTHLETERLLLRPVTLADATDMFEYASDDETTRFVFPKHETLEDTKISIATYFMAEPLGKYAIEEKTGGKMIGTIDLRVEGANGRGELGYTINKKYWGQGITPEASMALLALAFDKLKLIHVGAFHDQANPNSGRVMEKIGMKQEAVIPAARIMKGRIVDVVQYGLPYRDWQRHIL